MLRSKLRNKCNKLRTPEANLVYKRQRNICTSLLRKSKTKYYRGLNATVVADNKNFWKIVKPFLSDKVKTKDKISLSENNEIYDGNGKVANIFNTFFSHAVSNLNIQSIDIFNDPAEEVDHITKPIKRYDEHPYIMKIKEEMNGDKLFCFSQVRYQDIINEIVLFDETKAGLVRLVKLSGN